jgi:hypothetical protein
MYPSFLRWFYHNFMRRNNQRKVKGLMDWFAEPASYIALWNTGVTCRHFYLLGAAHRSGPWVEYLRWLQ